MSSDLDTNSSMSDVTQSPQPQTQPQMDSAQDGSEDMAVLESVKIAKSVGKLTRSQIRARRLPNGAVDMPHLSQVQYEALQRSTQSRGPCTF